MESELPMNSDRRKEEMGAAAVTSAGSSKCRMLSSMARGLGGREKTNNTHFAYREDTAGLSEGFFFCRIGTFEMRDVGVDGFWKILYATCRN